MATALLRLFVALVLLALPPLHAQSPPSTSVLTDDQVAAAINAVKPARWKSLFVEAKGPFGANYTVLIQGPLGRTMDLAREAYESYKPFSVRDVPKGATERAITVTILPHSGPRVSINNVVLLPVGVTSRDAAVQPIGKGETLLQKQFVLDQLPRTWNPGYASYIQGVPLRLRFAEDALPVGDFQIVVAADTGEVRYMVKAQDRERIR